MSNPVLFGNINDLRIFFIIIIFSIFFLSIQENGITLGLFL